MKTKFLKKSKICKIEYFPERQAKNFKYREEVIMRKLFKYKIYPAGLWEYTFHNFLAVVPSWGYVGNLSEYNERHPKKPFIIKEIDGESQVFEVPWVRITFEDPEMKPEIVILDKDCPYNSLSDYLEDLKTIHPEVEDFIDYKTLDCGVQFINSKDVTHPENEESI